MFEVFVSYRARDERFGAASAYDRLVSRLGADRVFLDHKSIMPGAFYPASILAALDEARVLVVLIGPEWLATEPETGVRLIDRQDDWVRREIRRALERGITIIPVLLGDASLPEPEALPSDIRDILKRQTVEVSHRRLGADLEHLVDAVARLVTGSTTGPAGGDVPRQLPAPPRTFVGRDAELREVRAAFHSESGEPVVVAIQGPPGVGKTAFLLQAAHELAAERFPDGQLFVELSMDPAVPHEDSDTIAQRLLRGLGLPDTEHPRTAGERVARLRSMLADKQLLLVFDNVASAAQIRPLLAAASSSGVLLSSRRPLGGLENAQMLHLRPLPGDASFEFLSELVGASRIAGALEDTAVIAGLCEGFPLALKLVGARLRNRPNWALSELRALLEDERSRLDVLDVDDQAVRTSLGIAYRGLTPVAARLFRALAAAPGIDAAKEITETLAKFIAGRPAPYVVTELVEAHLVEEETGGRFRYHDMIRLYAREKAAEEDTEKERNADVFTVVGWRFACALQAGAAYLPPGRRREEKQRLFRNDIAAMHWLHDEHHNLLCDIKWHVSKNNYETAALTADAVVPYLMAVGRWRETLTASVVAADAWTRIGDTVRALTAHINAAHAAIRLDDRGTAWEQLEVADRLIDDNADGLSTYRSTISMLRACASADDPDEAAEFFRQLEEPGNPDSEDVAMRMIAASTNIFAGEPQAAIEQLRIGADIARQAGQRVDEVQILVALSELLLQSGRSDEVLALALERMPLFMQSGERDWSAVITSGALADLSRLVGLASRRSGDLGTAEALLQSSAALSEDARDHLREGQARLELGELYLQAGRKLAAHQEFTVAVERFTTIGDADLLSRASKRLDEASETGMQERAAQARTSLEKRVLNARDAADNSEERAALAALIKFHHHNGGSGTEATGWRRRMVELTKQSGDVNAEIQALLSLLEHAESDSGQVTESLLKLADRLDDDVLRATALINHGVSLLNRKQPDEALKLLHAARVLAREKGLKAHEWFALIRVSMIYGSQGRRELASRYLAEAERIVERLREKGSELNVPVVGSEFIAPPALWRVDDPRRT